jgi:hypothetical protein
MDRPVVQSKRAVATAVGALLIAFGLTWHLVVAPRWSNRLSQGWTWQTHFVGVMTWAHPPNGEMPSHDTLAYFAREASVIGEGDSPGTLALEDTNTIFDADGQKPVWQYTYHAFVDARTGAHAHPLYRGEYYLFPRGVQKTTYRFRQSYVEGIPLAFQREEYLEDVLTYLFAFRGRGEYTLSYTTGTPQFRPLQVGDGDHVRCADDQFVFRAWVEPVTGEIVKIQESCRSGDYIYDGRTELPVQAVARWAGESSGDDVRFRLEHARRERLKVLGLGFYGGPALVVLGVLTCGITLRRRDQ